MILDSGLLFDPLTDVDAEEEEEEDYGAGNILRAARGRYRGDPPSQRRVYRGIVCFRGDPQADPQGDPGEQG